MHDIKTGKENKINVPAMPQNVPRMYKISHYDDDYKIQKNNDGYLLVQASPNLCIFIDKTGNPAQKDTVNWNSTPLFVIDCLQYMVGYLDNKTVEVISLVDQKAVQKLEIYPNWKRQNSSGSSSKSPKDKDKDNLNDIRGLYRTSSNHVIMYDNNEVLSLVPTPIQKQIEECIKHLRIEKGLKLLMKSSPNRNELRSFQAEAGFALLCNLQWKRSMEHFEISDVDPRDIIYLFPKIKFNGFDYKIQHQSAPQDCTIHDIIDEVLAYKRSITTQHHNSGASSSYKYDEEKHHEYLNGIYYLGQFLWKRRSEPSSDDLKLIGAELKLCVDTALLKIYVELIDKKYNLINQDLSHSAPFAIDDLLDYQEENACVESECERILIESQQYYNLALFYRSKKKLEKSLLALYKIGKTREWKGDIDESIDLTIDILSTMAESKDLWTYSRWVLIKSPSLAMNIFTHRKRASKEDNLHVKFDKVINYLNEDIISSNIGYEIYDDIEYFDYNECYLEFIVKKCESSKMAKYHDNLAYLYMKKISKLTKLLKQRMNNDEYPIKLEESQLISPSKLLQHAKKFQLYDEIIELNKKLKNHNAVLYTLVIDKKDHKSSFITCKSLSPLAPSSSSSKLKSIPDKPFDSLILSMEFINANSSFPPCNSCCNNCKFIV